MAISRKAQRARRGARAGQLVGEWLGKHGWLLGAAGCALLLARSVEFEVPDKVRVEPDQVAAIVGDAPAQDFSAQLENPQAVQLRATLRQYPRNDMDVASPDPEVDKQARILSQPVVTTIIGMSANIEQTIRLDKGELRVDLQLEATPRVLIPAKKGRARRLSLEHRVDVRSHRKQFMEKQELERTHLQSRGVLSGIEDGGYRIVFNVDDTLFALDLELNQRV